MYSTIIVSAWALGSLFTVSGNGGITVQCEQYFFADKLNENLGNHDSLSHCLDNTR